MAAHYQILWGAALFLCLWPPLPLASLCFSHTDLPCGSRACQSGSQCRGFCFVLPQPGFFFPPLVFQLSVYRSPPQGGPSWLHHLREPTEHCPIPLHLFSSQNLSLLIRFYFCVCDLFVPFLPPGSCSHWVLPDHLLPFPPRPPGPSLHLTWSIAAASWLVISRIQMKMSGILEDDSNNWVLSARSGFHFIRKDFCPPPFSVEQHSFKHKEKKKKKNALLPIKSLFSI